MDAPVTEEPASLAPDPAGSAGRPRPRRRGIRYGIVAASVIALAIAVAATLTPRSPPRDVGGTPDRSTLRVAGWARFHVGWAYVFADGRVVSDTGGGPLAEQWLSAYGLALLRLGQFDAHDLASDPGSIPAAAWSDRTLREYRPTSYAICPVEASGSDGRRITASVIAIRLPMDVRRHVAGTVGAVTHGDYEQTAPGGGPSPVQSCFIVSSEQARAVWAYTDPHPDDTVGRDGVLNPGMLTFGDIQLMDGTRVALWVQPLLPDGSAGSWGG